MSSTVLGPIGTSRLPLLFALASACAWAACTPRQPPASLNSLAEAYVRITLQLAQHRPRLVDAWTGPSTWRPGPRVPVATLRTDLDALIRRAGNVKRSDMDPTEEPRLAYLRGQLRALSLIARRLAGDSPRFAEEVQLSLGRAIPSEDTAQLSQARASLDTEIEGAGPLDERYLSFRHRFVLPEDRVERALSAAIEACRAATTPHVTLPGDQRVVVEFDPSIEWDAYAQYAGNHQTRLKLASRKDHDVASLLHMACHETYAGHHAQHVWIDDALVRGRGWLEFQLTPAFGPHLLITEGAAEAGVDLALPEAARAAVYRDVLLPAAGLPTTSAERLARVETLAARLEIVVPSIVGRYLDNEATADTTARALGSQALLVSPERFLQFAERQRVAAIVDPIGKAVVADWISRESTEADRWRRLQDLFTRKPFEVE